MPRSFQLRVRPDRSLFRTASRTLLLLFLLVGLATAQRKGEFVRDVDFACKALEKECAKLLRLKGIKWKPVHREFLKRAKKVRSDQEHFHLLVELVARLRDGHAGVRTTAKIERRPRSVGPGFFLFQNKKRLFVRNAWGAARNARIRPGMELLQIDGKKAQKWVEAREKELAIDHGFSTPQHARCYTLQRGLKAPAGTRLALLLRDPKGKRFKTKLTIGRDHTVPYGPAVTPEGLKWAGKNIAWARTAEGFGYLQVRRSRREIVAELDQALEGLGDVAGMILDYRANSGGRFDHAAFMGRFIPEGRSLSFASRIEGAGPKRFGGPVVVLIDGLCASAGETGSGAFKEEGRGYLIGETPTAGMSSQKTTIELPSKRFSLYVSVRSNKSWFNDGKGIEGIGVIPHEIVELDPKDVAEGRDTLILRAEALLKKFPQKKVRYDPRRFGWRRPR